MQVFAHSILEFDNLITSYFRYIISKSDIRRIWPLKLVPESEEDLKTLKLEVKNSTDLLNKLNQQQINLKDEIARYKNELENLNPEEELLEIIRESQSQTTIPSQSQRCFKLQHKVQFPNEVIIGQICIKFTSN